MTEEQAAVQAKDRTMFGALMLKAGDVDGYVSARAIPRQTLSVPDCKWLKRLPE